MAEEDIIFGKNRHFFGGIEPSHVPSLEVVNSNGRVMIRGSFPDDTVVDGQMLCCISGVEIRRGSIYPKDEFDGELIAKIGVPIGGTKSFVVVDENAKPDRSYFYSAFPYSSQGVYNRSTANHYAYNEPSPLSAFTAKSVYDSASDSVSVVLDWELPSSLTGVVICRSTTGIPTDPTVNVIADVNGSGSFIDEEVVVDTVYYYRAFPYALSDDDIHTYCYQEYGHVAAVTARKYEYLYGYDIDLADSDPDTRVSYPDDVDNAGFTPAYMDFTAVAFNYGDWNLAPGEHFMPRPCMLTYGCTVDHYLDPNDYTLQEDGTTASSVADSSFGGNAMMEWGKIYTKRWEEDGIYHFRCSDIKIDDDWDCWCNYDKNDNVIDHFYTAIYDGSKITTNSVERFRSMSGQSVAVSIALKNHTTYVTNIGSDWTYETYADRLLIQDLLVLMGKSTNGRAVYGVGALKSSGTLTTGTLNDKGLFYGVNYAGQGVKIFGMENWWGHLSRGIAGLYNVKGTLYYKITRGVHDGSTASDYTHDGTYTGYLPGNALVSTSLASSTDNVYISAMTTTEFGRMIGTISATGSATTYECDMLYYVKNPSATYCAYAGLGYSNTSTSQSGPFAGRYYLTPTAYNAEAGATIACKPSTA